MLLFLVSLVLSGCAELVVASLCAVSSKPSDLSTRRYETRVVLETADGTVERTSRYECTPTEYKCFGGEWYAQYPEPRRDPFELHFAARTLLLDQPSCAESDDAGTEWMSVPTAPSARLVIGGESLFVSGYDLEAPSALAVYGVRSHRCEVRRSAS